MKKKVLIVLCCVALLVLSVGTIVGIVMNQVAPVVTKFEKKKAEEIAVLKEKMPGYVFDADNRAGSVKYLFLLRNTAEGKAEKFVKQHHLKLRFPDAKIKTGYGVITLEFKKDDYTKAVHYALTKLSKKSSVLSASASVYSASSIKYKPDISLYAENPIKLEYKNDDESHDISLSVLDANEEGILDIDRILATKADFDAYVDLFAAEFEGYPEAFQMVKDQYSEEFFETNALLITKQITRGNLGYGLTVDNVYLSDNKIYVVIRTSRPPSESYVLPALLEKTFYLTINKDAIKGATELITLD